MLYATRSPDKQGRKAPRTAVLEAMRLSREVAPLTSTIVGRSYRSPRERAAPPVQL